MSKKSKAERLYELFGGVRPLARAIGEDATTVWRFNQRKRPGWKGRVPPHFNTAIIEAAAVADLPEGMTREAYMQAVQACLDAPICPACKRPLETGMKLDGSVLK